MKLSELILQLELAKEKYGNDPEISIMIEMQGENGLVHREGDLEKVNPLHNRIRLETTKSGFSI